MTDDVMLFGDMDVEEVDLFDEISSLDTDEENIQDLNEDLDPELIQQSVMEFKKLFTERDGSLSAGSGAMVIYQHLQAAGYECGISMEDKCAEVTARTNNDSLKTAMVERVEDLLDEMVFLEHDWKVDRFTVTSIATFTDNKDLVVSIKFKAV